MAKEKIKQYIRSFDIDKKIISGIDNGILILDDELKIYSFNKWLELHTNLKEDSIIGKRVDEIFKEINVKKLTRKIRTALIMGTPTFYTASTSKYLIPIKINRIEIPKYSFMQQDVSVIPFDEAKKLVALIITDQTNMANTNALLKENINKVKELNNELTKERDTIDKKILLLKFDKNFKITDVSQAYLELIEYEKDELVGRQIFEYDKHDELKNLKKHIIDSANKQTVFKFEYKIETKNNKSLYMATKQVPEYDIYGEHIGFILFKEDITASKELYEHQEQIILNSRFTAMGEMLSMIAHQWRQPLSAISSILISLTMKKELDILDSKDIDESYERMGKTIQYLSTTIDDFTNFLKSDKNLKEVELSTFFENSMIILKNIIASDEITCSQKIDNNIKIFTCQNELMQVIINIIKNSVDAFKENNIDNKQVIIEATKDKNNALIYIKDNAGGIEEKLIKKIFEPYFSTKSKNRTGLGLYMSKRITEENLKGTISVKSHDKNTEFLIKLPLRQEK
jgi:PAS domain S-box-containing protein